LLLLRKKRRQNQKMPRRTIGRNREKFIAILGESGRGSRSPR
jgi:hypothetical protein